MKLDLTPEEESFIDTAIGEGQGRWDGNPDFQRMKEIFEENPSAFTRIGSRLLQIAIGKRGCGPTVAFLIDNGVHLDIDDTAYNVLHEATWANAVDSLKNVFESRFIDATCVSVKKPHIGWPDNLSLMYWAAYGGYPELARFLIKYGVAVHHELKIEGNGERGTTALQEAVAPAIQKNTETIEGKLQVAHILIDDGANYDIYTACALNDPRRVTSIVGENSTWVTRQDDFKMTPMHWACRAGSLDCAIVLLNHGAILDPPNNGGRTPLHLAADHERNKLVTFLAEQGANINVQDKKGRTPLHRATYLGHAQTAEVLLEYGAHPEILNKSGKTAFDVVRKDAKYFKNRLPTR